MNNHISFFIKHSISNLLRNRQRTLFVLFCIAAGVAAIVSLRTLGLMIETALTDNLQSDLRGDMSIGAVSEERSEIRERPIDPDLIVDGGDFQPTTFSELGLQLITEWGEARDFVVSPGRREVAPVRARRAENPEGAETIQLIFIDTATYPFYFDLQLTDPPGAKPGDVFQNELDIVITEKLGAALEVGIGDAIRLSGSRDPFTVVGFVADSAEASLTDPSTLLFTFAYLDFNTGQERFNRTASSIRFQVPPGTDIREIEESFLDDFPGMRTRTTEDLRETNESITSLITEMITTMGLVSLLIGGIGIINTMLVVVRRRALEIGVLKTIGVQGRQITLMFMIEAIALGFVGSLLGSIIGLGLARLLQSVGEQLTSRSLAFQIYPEAVAIGLIAGTVVTVVFGFLPTLAAGRVRPNIVLNPSADSPIPSAGRLQSMLTVAALTLIIGLLVGLILSDFPMGIAVTAGTFVVVGLAGVLMWLVVYVFARIPSFGSMRFKLAQRAMDTHRGRTASTLLALTIGMFALSIILLFTNAVISLLEVSYDQEIGGNVLAFGQTDQANARLIDMAEELPGIRNIEYTELFESQLIAINGDEDIEGRVEAAREIAVAERLAEVDGYDELNADQQAERLRRIRTEINFVLQNTTEESSIQRNADDLDYLIEEGERLTAGSESAILMQTTSATRWLGFEVGDELLWEFENGERSTVTIVGFMPELSPRVLLELGFDANVPGGDVVSAEVIPPDVDPAPFPILIDAEPGTIEETVDALSAIPDSFVFETSLLQSFIVNLLDQLTALPIAVAILALFASAVIIANTVSLATLERRREIGIMKAIGLQGNQVLSLLLIENGVLGLLGGILGCTVGATLSAFVLLSDTTGTANFPFMTLLGLLGLAVAIAIIATLITAVRASREKPLIVLRYE